MKTAVQIGAGNIGRGFIGMLLSQAGYKVIFADVQKELVEALSKRRRYSVEVVGESRQSVEVGPVDGVDSNSQALIDALVDAELVTTAVGPNVLKWIAPALVRGIELAVQHGRTEPLNIIACENAVRATSQLKQLVLEQLPIELPSWVAFVDAAVDRIVPPMEKTDDVLAVRVEEFCEWLVEKSAFAGEVPDIPGMTAVDNLEAGVERKLFTLNTGHAVCAWVGQYLGFNTIAEAIADTRVNAVVRAVMGQSGAALIAKHHFDPAAHQAYIDKIIKRFENPYIVDDVARVGRQPIRKLSRGERIASPLSTALSFSLPVDKLLLGAAAAMHFHNDEDPQVAEMHELIKQKGVAEVFAELSGTGQGEVVADIYQHMEQYL
ncbi:mannitol-1-phosphate 5-dehydrogenase [Gynuella sunshinyii]|uniref:Mannitol-1-phosphate 5-dehydrogenase n=1 Tax=Gynuella sunshinyii YC6258 TaxID=1445510 RepID=A0A0C5VWC6_9GAMM|nr:mannitol-1-phosphate 5-dehydrogenase [Gynuella sunshinyii]AJQ97618.1 mannitol-1-phosphate/altronate dehydrogenase [Gynuella sunshinyii YC6258]